MTAEGRAVLKKQDARRREIAKATNSLPVCVFLDPAGQPYHAERERNRIKQWTRWGMQKAGIRGASFHTLRHTSASWMVQRGVPIASVRAFMRHRSIQTTLQYAHLKPEDPGGTVAALDAALAVDTAIDTNRRERAEPGVARIASSPGTIS